MRKLPSTRPPFTIGGQSVPAGRQLTLHLPLPRLYTHTEMAMPISVVHGRSDGPRLLVTAAIHGDELNGVEIIRRLLDLPQVRHLRGTLIAVPVINVYGFLTGTRYLPDRRDLNRSFPGSERGSLTSRLAHEIMTTLLGQATHGIDLHTGAIHRSNLPQIRADLADHTVLGMAQAFATPVIIDAEIRDGSFREAARAKGIPMLLYEGGEALRFEEPAIQSGVRGIVNVMRHLGMLPARGKPAKLPTQILSTQWLRASSSGILRKPRALGTVVRQDEIVGTISDPFGDDEIALTAPYDSLIIGRLNLPMVNEGEAVFHLARFDDHRDMSTAVAAVRNTMEDIPEPRDYQPSAD